MSGCCGEPFVGLNDRPFNPGEIRLYGRKQYCPKDSKPGKAENGKIILPVGDCHITVETGKDVTIASVGIIYGYAYEGHCYKLPKPRIMYLPVGPEAILSGDWGSDCGFTPELGYSVWSIDKLDQVVSMEIRADFAKALLLDDNTPGNRSPMAYAQTMALAPQRSRD